MLVRGGVRPKGTFGWMAAAFLAAALWPRCLLAKAEDDDAHLVEELLQDEQQELQPKVVDFSNHTWKEYVSIHSCETGATNRRRAFISEPGLSLANCSAHRDADRPLPEGRGVVDP